MAKKDACLVNKETGKVDRIIVFDDERIEGQYVPPQTHDLVIDDTGRVSRGDMLDRARRVFVKDEPVYEFVADGQPKRVVAEQTVIAIPDERMPK